MSPHIGLIFRENLFPDIPASGTIPEVEFALPMRSKMGLQR
jgi:hypothetical protein